MTSMSIRSGPALPGGLPPANDLDAWRAALVRRVVWIGLAAGMVPGALLLVDALQSGQWFHVLFCWAGMGTVAAANLSPRLPDRLRAQVSVGLLYLFQVWMLSRGSSTALLYMLACPVMAVLGVGTRSAIAALVVCTGTLVGLGSWLGVEMPLAIGATGDSLGRWLVLGGNGLMLGLLLVLSCDFLLGRLDEALRRQRDAAEQLRHSEQMLREVAAQVPGMVYRVRFGPTLVPHFVYASPGSQTLLGVEPQALLQDSAHLVRQLHPEDLPRLRDLLVQAIRQPGPQQIELRLCPPGQDQRCVALSSTEVARDADGVVHNGIMTDITARKQSEALVWHQAHFDLLTDLPNRLLLRQRLDQALQRCLRTGQPLALMLIDLDHFKEVNDTLGHARGDRLLVLAAERLRSCMPADATVARMGGDEFTVLLPTLDELVDVEVLAQRLLTVLAQPFDLGGERAHVSASIGVALCPQDASAVDDLLKQADQAMYCAKEDGRNRLARYTPALQDRAQLRLRLGNDLRDALADQQFELVYQPIVDLADGSVRKAEALLRWRHPALGLVSPAEFVPIAESTGLIGAIGDWVFRTAAQQVQQWRRALHPDFQISVNRSPAQFRDDLQPPRPWPEVLAEMGLPGSAITVEITEGLLLDSSADVARQLQDLRAAGMAVSLDDFGTGYSALAYLHQFDIDVLKIDRSFVSGMSAGDTGRKLCRAMVLLAHELGMQVVAEGVETAEQRDWLRAAGCDLAQGYFLGRPMAPQDFADWLARRMTPAAARTPATA